MTLLIAGSGAFGTALAVSLSANGPVTLLGRCAKTMDQVQVSRTHKDRLPGIELPDAIRATANQGTLLEANVILLCVPTQTLRAFLMGNANVLAGKTLVACCKGIDLETLEGPADVIAKTVPSAIPHVLTGPSFAADIARGLPTALTLAGQNSRSLENLQKTLTTPSLRIYRSADVIGAQLGGALKNVIAIAAGACIGASLGESARAALIARGFSEIRKLAEVLGARGETLMGLSGMGDLILTCSSAQSRNYSLGISIGHGQPSAPGVTVEGAATAQAVSNLAAKHGLELPVCQAVDDLVAGRADVAQVLGNLLSRPLTTE